MYEKFYGLKERPFTLFPDPDFLYLSPQHKLARAYLEYGLTQRLGFVVLTGEIGTGKTTLIKSLLKGKDRQQHLGVLYQTSCAAEDLLELLLREFEIKGHYQTRAARLAAFNQFLLHAYSRGEHVVLIVDEAQNLGPAALEELRLLSNIQSDKEPLLQVILVGQPNLRDRLRHPALRQLAQRVGVHFHLQPLDEEETKGYIQFRLARVGGSGIFTESALKKIFEYTQGVPRLINSWCDLALVAGFAEGRRELDHEFLETVVAAQGGLLGGPDTFSTGQGDAAAMAPELPEVVKDFLQSSKSAGSSEVYGGERAADFGHNHLQQEVMAISDRLTRLEGLVLDMTSRLMPAISVILSQAPPASEPTSIASHARCTPDSTLRTPPADTPAFSWQRWWVKLFGS
jgi:general secretion pathway protein A